MQCIYVCNALYVPVCMFGVRVCLHAGNACVYVKQFMFVMHCDAMDVCMHACTYVMYAMHACMYVWMQRMFVM